MVGIILASHGGFAPGILQSVSMVFGEQENMKAVALMPEDGPDDIRKRMEEAAASFPDPDNVVVFVDLWGGTPFNQANKLIAGKEDKWAIVAGMNLPMLISAVANCMSSDSAQEVAAAVLQDGKDGIKIYPETLAPAEAAAPVAAAAVPQGAIPEGTVLGDGKIKIGLARIDTRLLHGQVATGWTKAVNPDRIIAVSDAVSHDDLRKRMIMEAAPPGVKAHCVPIYKMCEVAKDPRFGDTKAMLLFETPQDALAAIEGGVEIETLNVGSMAHSNGKVAVNKVLSLDAKDVETFAKLKAHGIKFDVRKVPSDSGEDMDALIAKAKEGLGIK
ncbi:MAG: PTS sugar transporter subunit IIB [Lachnospiraceae bacterium]|nr:PTS sugar transporter subunit IIB [Lachnospiraceae bacterium]